MLRDLKHFYDFGSYSVDESERLLLRGDEVVPLTPKAFEMLLVLLESSGHVLTKEELMKRVWPDTIVEEANLSHNIYKLREALGKGRDGEKYIADGLITKLSNIKEIIVRPTSAVISYANPEKDPLAAGREQKVDLVLDGRVQRSGDRIRVTVQLLSVGDAKPIWADQFDERSADIFSVQDSISQRVVRALVPQLTGEEQRRLVKRYTQNVEAYNLYLKGRFFWNKFDEEGLRKAIDYFNQAIAIDPDYALAYTGLANAYNVQGAIGFVPPAQTWQKAKAAAEKAIALDDTLAPSHQALGALKLLYEWDWPGAERELNRAIELDPNEGGTHELYAYGYQATGQPDKALSEMRRAQELAPL